MTEQSDDPDRPSQDPSRVAAKRIDRVNEWLQLGGALPPEEYQRLRDVGVTHVVDLREKDEADIGHLKELGITRLHIPVPNHSPPTVAQLTEVASWLDQADQGACVYVHCQGGFGRAATMAAGLLVVNGAAPEEAVESVRASRPEMRLNEEQSEWLRAVKQDADDGNAK